MQMQMQTFTALDKVARGLVSVKRDTNMILYKVDAIKTQLLDLSEIPVPRLFIVLADPEAKSWFKPR